MPHLNAGAPTFIAVAMANNRLNRSTPATLATSPVRARNERALGQFANLRSDERVTQAFARITRSTVARSVVPRFGH